MHARNPVQMLRCFFARITFTLTHPNSPSFNGGAENDGHKNGGQIAGHENAGNENARHDKYLYCCFYQSQEF